MTYSPEAVAQSPDHTQGTLLSRATEALINMRGTATAAVKSTNALLEMNSNIESTTVAPTNAEPQDGKK